MNSEIYGVATNSRYGFIYGQRSDPGMKENKLIKQVSYQKSGSETMVDGKFVPLNLNVEFREGTDENLIRSHISGIFNILSYAPRRDDFNVFYPDSAKEKKYNLKAGLKGNFIAVIPVLGIPKHPTQIYEASAYLLIFLFLIWLYYRKSDKLPKESFSVTSSYWFSPPGLLLNFIKMISPPSRKVCPSIWGSYSVFLLYWPEL